MATTTNFGWTTPDDTDLVKNGASAIRSLGSAIDTTAASTFLGQKLISTTSLTGPSISLSSIPQTYKNLRLVVRDFLPATDAVRILIRFNGDANTRYGNASISTLPVDNQSFGSTSGNLTATNDNAVAGSLHVADIFDYTNATTRKFLIVFGQGINATTTTNYNAYGNHVAYNQTAAITSIDLIPSSGNFTSGSVLLYGVQ